ncbi:MAG: rhodanese-like domain-containing protein [Chromatiales bacterium]|nr:MAG: rhodanese-like domain-containing protein [Chromatiales bacterium]
MALVSRGALLVDVRSAEEFSTGHVEGAINIPHLDVEKRLSEFGENRDRQIVLYCRSGHRAGLAQESLKALGYTQVFNAGGFEAWLSAGESK